ncbi:hypothetical protein JCM10212_005950 [Sporobolomyces blumeae]
MSTTSKSTKEARTRDFVSVTGCSSAEATRYLKTSSWRLEPALDAYFNDPRTSSAAQPTSAAAVKALETVWNEYCDADNREEIGLEGTLRYCEDLGVNPEQIEMLALAWFTKAPTMGRFAKKNWIDAWLAVQRESIERQREYIATLRNKLGDPDGFRDVYAFSFDYAKTEGQKSMPFEIAQELWNLLIPLDPNSTFPAANLAKWLQFLEENGKKVVSKDTWNLFLEFTRTIDPDFKSYDEEGAFYPGDRPGAAMLLTTPYF